MRDQVIASYGTPVTAGSDDSRCMVAAFRLKTAYRDGTMHVVFEPLDFMAKLAALVPRPRNDLTRRHGVLARGGLPSDSRYREHIIPTRSVREKTTTDEEADRGEEPDQTAGKHKGMC